MCRPTRRRRGSRVELDGGDGARQRIPPRNPCLDCLGTAGGRVRKLPRARAATRLRRRRLERAAPQVIFRARRRRRVRRWRRQRRRHVVVGVKGAADGTAESPQLRRAVDREAKGEVRRLDFDERARCTHATPVMALEGHAKPRGLEQRHPVAVVVVGVGAQCDQRRARLGSADVRPPDSRLKRRRRRRWQQLPRHARQHEPQRRVGGGTAGGVSVKRESDLGELKAHHRAAARVRRRQRLRRDRRPRARRQVRRATPVVGSGCVDLGGVDAIAPHNAPIGEAEYVAEGTLVEARGDRLRLHRHFRLLAAVGTRPRRPAHAQHVAAAPALGAPPAAAVGRRRRGARRRHGGERHTSIEARAVAPSGVATHGTRRAVGIGRSQRDQRHRRRRDARTSRHVVGSVGGDAV